MITEHSISSLDELKAWAENFISRLTPLSSYATIITFSGDLGAGKTSLVQQLALALGIQEEVTSPTFVIQREYKIEKEATGFEHLIHLDAYRLESKSELEYLKWKETIGNPKNIVCIEWPEMVEGIALPNAIHIQLEITQGETRVLTLKTPN